MPLRSHLLRRGRRYYFRRRVPSDLVKVLGRKEIIKSLRVSCPRQAARLALGMSLLFEEFFDGLRNMESKKDWDAEEQQRKKDFEELKRRMAERRQRGTAGSEEKLIWTLDSSTDIPLPKRLGGDFDTPALEYRVDLFEVAREWSKEAGEAKDQALEAGTALANVINGSHQASATTRDTSEDVPTISEFLHKFIAERQGQWDESAKRHNTNYIRLFQKIIDDKPLSDFTREDIVEYVRTLQLIHKNYGKSSKDTDLDLDSILLYSEGKQPFNITTLKKHVRCVKALFTTANRYLENQINIEKLFGAVQFRKDAPKPQQRKPWTIEDLNMLFATPIWTGTSAQKASLRYRKGRKVFKDAYWWLPVVAIFTGMRLEEICQLQKGDWKTTKNGFAYLAVAEGEGRRLKTDSSIRDVPVHPTLASLGFGELFTGSSPADRVFPELCPCGPQGKFGYQYSQDFTVYRRQTGLYEELKDFHSFRHTFATHLRRSIKDVLMVGEIVGHETKQIETETYTHPSVEDKFAAISKLDYEKEGLEIGHLFPSRAS